MHSEGKKIANKNTLLIIICNRSHLHFSSYYFNFNYWNSTYYYKPYNRIGPFIIGIYVAYSLYIYKHSQSADSKIKKFMEEINNSFCMRIWITIIGIFLFFGMIFLFYPMNSHPENFGTAFNAIFLTFSKSVFIAGFSLMILPLLVGKGDMIRNLLSGSIMTPISRLSYGVFLWFTQHLCYSKHIINKEEFGWAQILEFSTF